MKILLQTKTSGVNYSIEAGLADGVRNFDHHGQEMSHNPCPATDTRIPVVEKNAVVEISHIDCDTFLGLKRMAGHVIPEVIDTNMVSQIDLNGSFGIENLQENMTYSYMVGVGEVAKALKFPRCSETSQEVTEIVQKMLDLPAEEFLKAGKEAIKAGEETYRNCKVKSKGKIGFWSIDSKNPFDPSRPYQDGYEVVVVFRKHYKTISLYAAPQSTHKFFNKKFAGIEFAGHEKAAGSPRGQEMTEVTAIKVFEELVNN